MFCVFEHCPWWLNLCLALVYTFFTFWNLNTIAHYFVHTPWFRSPALNRLFSLIESMAIGYSQTFFNVVHMTHHVGNNDRRDAAGDTADWLSFYRYGKNGLPENVWAFTFLSYFRDDPKETYRKLKAKSTSEARWGIFEIVMWLGMWAIMAGMNWKFIVFLLPFYYLVNCLSSWQGYYRHYGGNPDEPLAWGVSSHGKLYNLLWFNNGYHAEHHYRPRCHWTKVGELHAEIKDEQVRAGTLVLSLPHMLAPLDKRLSGQKQRYEAEALSVPTSGASE